MHDDVAEESDSPPPQQASRYQGFLSKSMFTIFKLSTPGFVILYKHSF